MNGSDSSSDSSGSASDSSSSDSSVNSSDSTSSDASSSDSSSDSTSSDASSSDSSSDSSDSSSSDSCDPSSSSSSGCAGSSAWPDAAAGGWNASIRETSGWCRVPLANLKSLNNAAAPNGATKESASNRAIAFVPTSFDPSTPVEILVHLHGHNIGSRESAATGVRDVATDAIPAQLAAAGRRLIALLPQGTVGSLFGPTSASDFDIPAFIGEALAALVSAGTLSAKPDVASVAVSAHSGGGGALAVLLSQSGMPRIPSSLEAEFLFEAINGPNELATQTAFLTAKLTNDLAAVNAATDADAALRALATSFRFVGFYNSDFYVPFYTALAKSLDGWFAKNAGALGGTSDPVYLALRANYAIIKPSPGIPHDEQVDHDHLLTALKMLP